jgi:ATP-dependent DNA helicase RecG
MRPEILYPAFAATTSLAGCGPRLAKLIAKIAGTRVVDLWWHLPSGLIDRSFAPPVAEAPEGQICTLTLRVDKHVPPPVPRRPYVVRCSDETGALDLVFFHAHGDYLTDTLPVDSTRVVSGRVERYRGRLSMIHPDRVATPEEAAALQGVEPVYPLTAGLTLRPLVKIVTAALARLPDLPEWLDKAGMGRKDWPSWGAALREAHRPQGAADLAPTTPARTRLAYDELLANQLALALVRAGMKRRARKRVLGDGRLAAKVAAALPYKLTGAQTNALAEIAADLASPRRMLRLLQGDVGSGKTVVAMLAMVAAVESGAQAALMAPTEILARQHAATLAPWCQAAGIRLALLTGRDKGKDRAETLRRLAAGEIGIVVGTHALFQEDVEFHDLALAVIDEQHRFGVHQRLTLTAKGQRDKGGVDILVMTATPIPRTLALTAYGDMDISKLTEKPPGRRPIDTRAMPLDRLDEVVAAVRRKLATGARAYWVCPLVAESEAGDLAAAEERHRALSGAVGAPVGLLHGRMTAPERDRAMADFIEGRTRLLVATTVIEVGVDVPEAVLMVVECAERFGLAQLHQLRGRVGRGTEPGTCLLLYQPPLGETAKARLRVLRETDDGFRIAEEDMRLRGAGEILGTRQSGVPEFRLADLAHHGDALAVARDDARLVLTRDPRLQGARGQALRVLLYLFERDAAVRLLDSG